jgi:formate dehydrogenase family accessory protein FdhD
MTCESELQEILREKLKRASVSMQREKTGVKRQKSNIATVDILKVLGGAAEQTFDRLSVEEPLEIVLSGSFKRTDFSRVLAATMRTPGNDEELAVGFLLSEGIVSERADVRQIRKRGCNSIEIGLRPDLQVKFEDFDRHSVVNSSCGVCGKKSIESIMSRIAHSDMEGSIETPMIRKSQTIDGRTISTLPIALRYKQSDFEITGGIHACALFDLEGRLIEVREDVGRHNALDKLIGSQLMADNLPLDERVLLLSGRASFELIQKAAAASVPIVAAVGAPSSLAVELAEKCNITLLGFVRNDRFNIYSGGERIVLE